jgi:hypothetical protein
MNLNNIALGHTPANKAKVCVTTGRYRMAAITLVRNFI